jgi:hypothetical protein
MNEEKAFDDVIPVRLSTRLLHGRLLSGPGQAIRSLSSEKQKQDTYLLKTRYLELERPCLDARVKQYRQPSTLQLAETQNFIPTSLFLK